MDVGSLSNERGFQVSNLPTSFVFVPTSWIDPSASLGKRYGEHE
jgi:hypothetical protein